MSYCCLHPDTQVVFNINHEKLRTLEERGKFIYDDQTKQKRINDDYIQEKVRLEKEMKNKHYKEPAVSK